MRKCTMCQCIKPETAFFKEGNIVCRQCEVTSDNEKQKEMRRMEKEKALADLILITTRLTKEANSVRGESKKSMREYAKALVKVCDMLEVDPEVVENIVEPS